ncbi:MAG: hypothetical protein JW723_03855 [Bacteroidales bacterium]|nr:hypothetical protein [Bacteroidales bacterium]
MNAPVCRFVPAIAIVQVAAVAAAADIGIPVDLPEYSREINRLCACSPRYYFIYFFHTGEYKNRFYRDYQVDIRSHISNLLTHSEYLTTKPSSELNFR